MEKRIAGVLFIGALIIAIALSIAAAKGNLTLLENALLQVLSLGLGLTGSYIFGRMSAREAARDLVQVNARSAFRRLLSLYTSLSRLATAIQGARNSGSADSAGVLDKLEARWSSKASISS